MMAKRRSKADTRNFKLVQEPEKFKRYFKNTKKCVYESEIKQAELEDKYKSEGY